jgi:hypothetical protein
MAHLPTMTIFRDRIMAALEDLFSSEGLIVYDDKLHASLGHENPVAGVFPIREAPSSRHQIYQEVRIGIQLYMHYDREINPEQTVSPKGIEEWVDRLLRDFDQSSNVNDPNAWYWNVVDVNYLDDPTGNKTRAELTLIGFGPNQSIAPGPA